jgi:molybdate transport system substrate-binding protein
VKSRTRVATALAATLLATGLALSGCSASGTPTSTPTPKPTATTDSETGSLTVYAAASLTATFTTLGNNFMKQHPGVKVNFDFNGSSTLVTQMQQGAPADVFASADQPNMQKAQANGNIDGTPITFATNTLEIAVPPGNPANIKTFADLAKPGVKVVVCAVGVPCGTAAQTIEQKTGITITPVSQAQAVTDVLAQVASGQADAGLVYVSDVATAAGKVEGVTFPESKDAVNAYPIAKVKGSKEPKIAQQFIDLVTSKDGQKVLAAAKFGPAK